MRRDRATPAISRLAAAAAMALALAGPSAIAAADAPVPAPPAPLPAVPAPAAIAARSAVLLDAATGSLLYAKNPDLVVPPASLAKLVALHVVYGEIAAGRLSKDELVAIDARDCSPNVPLGSSLMYLQPGMRVSVLDLMRGMAVVSGNDAVFALARRVSGSNEAFALLMNRAVAGLGFPAMRFVEPSGLSELSAVTARDFAAFSRRYLELHPGAPAELHSIRYIEFPRPEHSTADYVPEGRIIQYNRNNLVLDYPGCDGLKTGFIIEAGYNLAATAERDGTRFILASLGGEGSGGLGGGTARDRDGTALLDWAFRTFATRRPDIGTLPPVRSFFGAVRGFTPVPAAPLAVTLPLAEASGIRAVVEVSPWIDAPVAKGARVGEVRYLTATGMVARRVDLVAPAEIPRGNLFVRIRDAFARFFQRLFRSGPFRS